jgi:hypothetical protein
MFFHPSNEGSQRRTPRKSIRHALLFALVFSSQSLQAQYPVFPLLDSALALMDGPGYTEGARLYRTLEPARVDPRQKLSVCLGAFYHHDSSLFKEVMLDLVANHGFLETGPIQVTVLRDALERGGYADWLAQKRDSCRSHFFHTHLNRMEVIRRIHCIHKLDQARALVLRYSSDDSVADSIIAGIDQENLRDIIALANEFGLPNDFDDLWNTSGIVELVLFHCGKNPHGFQQRWDAVMPYLDKAFAAGKIGSEYLRIYDTTMHMNTGFQYYGTLENVTVQDPEGLRQRRNEHGLVP